MSASLEQIFCLEAMGGSLIFDVLEEKKKKRLELLTFQPHSAQELENRSIKAPRRTAKNEAAAEAERSRGAGFQRSGPGPGADFCTRSVFPPEIHVRSQRARV